MIRVLNLAKVPVRTFTTTPRQHGVPQYGCSIIRSVFSNGLNVVIHKPYMEDLLSTCTVMFQAGSRYETAENLGVTHFLRNGSVMSGLFSTDFMRARMLQEHGAYLSCCGDRQYIAYVLHAPAYLMNDFKCTLADVSVRNHFPEWEMEQIREMVRKDLTRRDPVEHVMDLVQKAIFTEPLNNSIYCEEDRVDSITVEHMANYVNTYFKPSNCCIGSVGMPIEDIEKIAYTIGSPTEKTTICFKPARVRSGYEYYDTGPGGDTYIALAVQGPGQGDFQSCLTYAILAAAVGHGNVTDGQHNLDRTIQKPLGNLVEPHDCYTLLSAFSIAHAEIGLFGILIKTTSPFARCVTFRAADFLYNIRNISPEQICLGKKRLLMGITLHDCPTVNIALNQAAQASCVPHENSNDFCAAIAAIPIENVQCAAQCVSSRRCCTLALGVLGDVVAVPHDGELRAMCG